MENTKEAQYDFCPRCGATTENGVCMNCAGQNPEAVQEQAAVEVSVEVTQQEETQPVETVQTEEIVQSEETAQPTGGYYGSPYSEYANQISYSNGAIPPDVPVKKTTGKTIALACVCVGIVVLLLGLIGYCIFSIVRKVDEQGEKKAEEYLEEDFWDDKYDEASELPESDSDDEEYDYKEFYKDIIGDNEEEQNDSEAEVEEYDSEEGKTYGYSPEDDYYEGLDNCLRNDLSYSVEFEEEEYYDRDGTVYIGRTCPVLSGDIPNLEHLNEIIYGEYLYFQDFYKEELQSEMTANDYFMCRLTGYVPYMDEEHLSIVFNEEAWAGSDYYLALYCINIDVENGVVLNNTELLEINDDFSVEFRIREGRQNNNTSLDVYTDQELTEMLSDPIDLIIYYTPLGMEIGVNYDGGWATVTYKDYKKYLKKF